MITAKDILDMSVRVDVALTELNKTAFFRSNGWVLHDDVADGFVPDYVWDQVFRYEPYWAELCYRMIFSGYETWPDDAAERVAWRINVFGWQSFVKWAESFLQSYAAEYATVYPAHITDDEDIVAD